MTTSDVPNAPSYRGLVAVVIILGALIMVALGALIAGALMGGGRSPAAAEAYVANLGAPGSHIESAELVGNRILVRLAGGGGDELVLLEASTGRVIGRVRLSGAP